MRRSTSPRLFIGISICCSLLSATAQAQVVVRMETNMGNIDVELYDQAAPVTVNNFLKYVNSGRYNGTFIHRSEPGFVLQGGSYYTTSSSIGLVPTYAPIVNEYDPSRSNVRGTIAMAKQPDDPNSATSGWFFNLADNNYSFRGNTVQNLDAQNDGFTVFGQVIGNGMDVVDAITSLNIVTCSSAFNLIPVIDLSSCPDPSQFSHLVKVNRVRALVGLTPLAPATVSNIAISDNPSPSDAPGEVTFDQGFFSFQVNNLTPGGSTMVAMQFPVGYTPNTYYMYGPTPDNPSPHWYEFKFDGRTGAEFFNNNFVVLNFVDGERGDSDLTANGQISDPGAPGISATTTPISSGSGGGCTLATAPSHRPIPVEFWFFALAFAARLTRYVRLK